MIGRPVFSHGILQTGAEITRFEFRDHWDIKAIGIHPYTEDPEFSTREFDLRTHYSINMLCGWMFKNGMLTLPAHLAVLPNDPGIEIRVCWPPDVFKYRVTLAGVYYV